MGAHGQLLTLGLPCIRKEPGEVRDFLPPLAGAAARSGAGVWVESGYGAGMGYRDDDYESMSPSVRICDHATAMACDIVLVLRPSEESYDLLNPGSTFISMLHFPTHKDRARRLKELGIEALALDLIVNDEEERLVENMRAVAWNGLDAGFGLLDRLVPLAARREQPPVHVTILGAGMVGKHAVEAATKFGSLERAERLSCECRPAPGVEVITLGRNLTGNAAYMKRRLARTDMLVDASRRSDPSRPMIPNRWLADLPPHAVVVDLATDLYLLDEEPRVVRGIEGIPVGDLDHYVFAPDDPAWDAIPMSVTTAHRRWVVSCYSWPGVYPLTCMERYGHQIEPLLQALIRRGGAAFLRPTGGYFERALKRATLAEWMAKL